MNVYHGSTYQVTTPIVSVGRDNLDFGKGFYVTDLEEQAIQWALRGVRLKRETWLNIYSLDIEAAHSSFRTLSFKSYNTEWLDFVIQCRMGEHPWKDYDLIEGGIANDRIFNTIELYQNKLISKEETLKRLIYEKPNNQICILNQQLVETCLQYTESILIRNNETI